MLESEVYNLPNKNIEPSDLSGQGLKKLLVIALSNDLGDGGREKLGAIIKAINYDIEQDCYFYAVEDEKEHIEIGPVIRSQDITHILMFGVNPKKVGFNIHARLYMPLVFEQFTYILSHQIKEMNENRKYKLALWNCLQKVFLGK